MKYWVEQINEVIIEAGENLVSASQKEILGQYEAFEAVAEA